jgi:hypothetical protein
MAKLVRAHRFVVLRKDCVSTNTIINYNSKNFFADLKTKDEIDKFVKKSYNGELTEIFTHVARSVVLLSDKNKLILPKNKILRNYAKEVYLNQRKLIPDVNNKNINNEIEKIAAFDDEKNKVISLPRKRIIKLYLPIEPFPKFSFVLNEDINKTNSLIHLFNLLNFLKDMVYYHKILKKYYKNTGKDKIRKIKLEFIKTAGAKSLNNIQNGIVDNVKLLDFIFEYVEFKNEKLNIYSIPVFVSLKNIKNNEKKIAQRFFEWNLFEPLLEVKRVLIEKKNSYNFMVDRIHEFGNIVELLSVVEKKNYYQEEMNKKQQLIASLIGNCFDEINDIKINYCLFDLNNLNNNKLTVDILFNNPKNVKVFTDVVMEKIKKTHDEIEKTLKNQ